MKTRIHSNSQGQGEQVLAKKATVIYLGIDVHSDNVRVVRQIDGAAPQPAQKFTHDGFLRWAAKQRQLACRVHSCYEAGPFGFVLHRRLVELGIDNVVVRPQNWDELGKGVKTDKTDALAMVLRLERYVRGNRHALAVVRVPTVQEEMARWETRQRQQLRKERQRLEAQGRSLLLTQGVRVSGRWWLGRRWEALRPTLHERLAAVLERTRGLIEALHAEVEAMTIKLEMEARARGKVPKGVGGLTSEVLGREVCDWNRFSNRRQVASMTGLCPGVYASNRTVIQGSITKHGNPRLRAALVELAWRLLIWQPQYRGFRRWGLVLRDKKAPRSLRKKAIVAVARQLAIDLWRLNTGRRTAEQLGLTMAV